jgi:hypothetical protein
MVPGKRLLITISRLLRMPRTRSSHLVGFSLILFNEPLADGADPNSVAVNWEQGNEAAVQLWIGPGIRYDGKVVSAHVKYEGRTASANCGHVLS